MVSSSHPSSSPHGRRAIAALAMAAVLGIQAIAPASADHGGRPIGSLFTCDRPVAPPRCTSVGDNLRHHVYFDPSLTPELAAAMRGTMLEDYDPTDLTMIEDARITRLTDVIVFSQDYGDNGAAGWVYCPRGAPRGFNLASHRWCRQQELHLNLNPRYALFFDDEASRDHITCHELGHTLGLRHWGNPPHSNGPPAETCMNANTPNGPTGLHQIDIDHMNAYPYSAPPPGRGFTIVRAPGEVVAALAGSGVEAVEIEHYPGLQQLAAGADAVVRGRVVEVRAGRVFAGFHYAAATVVVDELVAGALPARHGSELTLEIPLFGGPSGLAELQSAAWAESLFFLRHKGGAPEGTAADAEFYRLVTMRAMVVNLGGLATVPEGEGDYLDALVGDRFDEVVARVGGASD